MEENETFVLSALCFPFAFLVVAIPFGFLLGEFIHGIVGLPRWIVEHAGA